MVNIMVVYFLNQGTESVYAEMNTCRGGQITSLVTQDYLLIICEEIKHYMLSQTPL